MNVSTLTPAAVVLLVLRVKREPSPAKSGFAATSGLTFPITSFSGRMPTRLLQLR